jgi:hypothetical protein
VTESGRGGGPVPAGIVEIFAAALGHPPADRGGFLDGACGGDAELRARVEALLRSHDLLESESGDGGFLRTLDPIRAAALVESADPPPRPGEQVGRYRIIRPLGRGGMGIVYLAYDPELDRPVALKFLPHLPGVGSPGEDLLLEEARAASALDHPNIGTVFEVGDGPGGRRFIAMASYEGGMLRDRLGGAALPLAQAIDIARQVAEGLGAAHARGIVHRDVKPENLVFDGEGRVKIVDFGLATVSVAREGPRRLTGGTAGYMAPEQVGGERVDARADVWAAGIALHEMLTGHRPAAGEDGYPVLLWPAAIPPGVRRVVERCLSPDPGARYPSGVELARELQALSGPPAVPPGPRRRTLVAGAVAVAGVALLAGFLAARELPRVTAATGWAGGALGEQGRVVVADFEWGSDGDAGVAMAAREALAVDLQQSGFVNVLGRGQVAGIMGRMGLAPETSLDLPVALEVAERAGAGAVLTASVARAGTRYVLAGRALDPATGSELFAVRTQAGESRVLGAVERLSREMRRRLGEDPEGLRRSRPLPEVTTPSLEALRLYAEAETELVRDGRRAAALLASAVELDSTFAMAHRMAAAVAYTALRFGEGALHLEKAHRFRDRLPERERLHVEALHEAQVTYRPERAAATYEVLVSLYPMDPAAWNNLGVMRQGWMDDHPGALEAFLRGAEADAGFELSLTNAALQSAILEEWAQADSLVEVAAMRGLDAFVARWGGRRAFARGRIEEARRECAGVLAEVVASSIGSDDLEVCGSMDVAAGHLQDGSTRLEASAEVAYREARYRNVAHAAHGLSLAALYRGDREAARASLAGVPERIPDSVFREPDRFLTRTSLRVHATLLREWALVDRIASAWPPHAEPDHWLALDGEDLVAAADALARGEAAGALEALARRESRGLRPVGWRVWDELIRGWALERTGDLDGAAAAFARAAAPGFLVVGVFTKDRLLLPLALDALIRVEESRGNAAGAGEARRRLEGLWSPAGIGAFPRDPFRLAPP